VISVFLQQERGYSAIQTGLTLVPATGHPAVLRDGPAVGIALLLLARADSANWTFWPGLFLIGFGSEPC
jgi:hypothetical protein